MRERVVRAVAGFFGLLKCAVSHFREYRLVNSGRLCWSEPFSVFNN